MTDPGWVTCEECGVWPVQRARDRFCGWCGSPLLEAVLMRDPGGERVGGRDYVRRGQRELVYQLRLSGSLARSTPEVARADGQLCRVDPAGSPGLHLLTVPWDSRSTPEGGAARLDLKLVCPPLDPREIALEIWPAPALQAVPAPDGLQEVRKGKLHAAFVDARADAERVTVRVSSRAAPVVPRRVGVRAEKSEEVVWDRAGLALTPELAVRLHDLGKEVGLEREVRLEIERRGPWPHGRKVALTLLLECEGLAALELPVELAQLARTGGDLQPDACEFEQLWVGRAEPRHARWTNSDDFELVVREVAADPPWLRVVEYAPGARLADLRPLRCPIRLAPAAAGKPGGTLDFTVVADAAHPAFPKDHPGDLAGLVTFELDGPLGRREYPVRAGRVSRPESLAEKGFLAIDFGTTNTCCALKLEGREVEVVPFGPDRRTSVPSAIFFEDLTDPAKPRYRVGVAALAQAKARSEASLAKNFKRRIGLGERERVRDPAGRTASYLPEELAAFYLKEVLAEVREHLARRGTPVEVDSIVFTHPVLFSPRQVEVLAGVFRKLGAEARPALDEASAGAIQYVHGWANEEYKAHRAAGAGGALPRRVEHVLNYDFGGGTIDIALLEVEQDFPSKMVTCTPVGVSGLHRFGGEDITVLVREMLVRRIERLLRRRHPRFSLPCGDLSQPPGLYQAKKQNNARLGFLAEKAKIEVFEKGSTTLSLADPNLDHLWVDRGEGGGLEQVDAEARPLLGDLDEREARVTLRLDEVERVIAPLVEASVDRAYNLWRSSQAGHAAAGEAPRLDRVILTGRSSSIPLVKKRMAARLSIPEEQIVHDPGRAKEVVAQGACYMQRLQSLMVAGLRFLPGEREARLLVPIGMERIDFSESVFHPLFPHGTVLSKRPGSDGQLRWFAEREMTFDLVLPVASLQLFRSLDYTDPITSGGKDLIARFELRRDDPFFADWTPQERLGVPVRFQLWKPLEGGPHQLEVAVRHPRSGAERVFRSTFTNELLATVGEEEEARGLLAAEPDTLPEAAAGRSSTDRFAREEWK